LGQRLDNATNLYLEAIRDGDYEQAINTYAGQRYTQHSTPVKDGKAGFVEFFADFLERNPIRDIEILRGFEDGPYVFLHVLQTLNNGEFRYVTADIFDTGEDGKLIEHWDIIAEVTSDTSSDHTQIDGPTEPTDLNKTAQNKSHVRSYLTEVLGEGRYEKIGDYISRATYVEHSVGVEDEVDNVIARLRGLAAAGVPLVYNRIHRIVGSGSFVAALSEASHGETGIAIIDLYRVEDGLIVEHWDVTEEITPPDTWVNTGKF
jgi:predicted SnoaL-like aldol condensation-catalyzing enzyme